MRILIQGRSDLIEKFGGDSSLILGLTKSLKKRGIYSEINPSDKKKQSFKLAHFFGIMRIHDLYPMFLKVRDMKIPIIVTPIYEDLTELDLYGRIGLEKFMTKILTNDKRELLKGIIRGIKDSRQLKNTITQLKTSYTKQQKILLQNANIILASTKKEKELLLERFKFPESKMRIIPFGINSNEVKGDSQQFIKQYGIKEFILCVGRIEPKKNQLSLIKALDGVNIPIVFIGSLSEYHKFYVKEFLRKIKNKPNIKYLGSLDNEMLLSAYASAKVHVLSSWFEAPGLTSMEAALNNCNIVTTKNGYAREYFNDYAWYCDPRSPKSIKKSVLEAYNSKYNSSLQKRILRSYSLNNITSQIINGYESLIGK